MKIKFKNFYEKNKKDIYLFIGMFVFTLILCTNILKIHFAQDTYCLYSYGYKKYAIHFLLSARLFSALELLVAQGLDITFLTNLKIMFFLVTIFMTISWYLLYKILNKIVIKKDISSANNIAINILMVLATFIVLYNFASCEMFMFAESGIIAFSILLSIIAAYLFCSNYKYKYLLSFIFVVLSSFAYQASISIFVMLALILEMYKNKDNIKKIVGEALSIGIFYGLAYVLNLVTINIIEKCLNERSIRNTSTPNIADIIETIKVYGKLMVVETFKVFPKNMYVILITLISIYTLYNIIRSKKYFGIAEYIVIVLVAFIMPLLPVMAEPKETQYLEPRMVLSYAALPGILVLYNILKFDINSRLNKNIAMFFAVIIFTINSQYFIKASTENISSVYLDRNVAESILTEIYNYQNENNVKIKNIGIAFDQKPETYYNGQPPMQSTNVRSMVTDWAAVEVLEFYSGEKYNKVETPNDIKQEFLKYDWKFFNQKQVVFRGDTVYICLY